MNKKTLDLLNIWERERDNMYRATPVDLTEDPIAKQKRVDNLQKDFEAWAAYYFPNFYTSKPAPFHVKSSQRIINNPEWYEVRSWSRELAKSTRTMMEVLFLALTGKKKNILLVSNSYDNAKRLLAPYKKVLELNDRIICDYGRQETLGKWEEGEFVTKGGVSFRALGKGQSPRGTRNDADRPDVILLDDIDTDEECRNPDRIKEAVKWIEEALIPTRSISGKLLLLACGNIIASYCCITEMAKKADKHDIVNIRTNGVSSWPQKNTEEHIDRVLSQISYNSAQKEYFNNPIVEGDVFKEINYGKLPKISSCEQVLVYSDPATSNKDKGNGSTKAIGIIGKRRGQYYLYKVWLDQMSNASFVDYLFEAFLYCRANNVDTCRVWIENNSLQNPFYEQVILPMIRRKSEALTISLPITPDTRNKGDKYTRIEGTLEPLNRLGNLMFNIDEKANPHMARMEGQMLGVSIKAKMMDGPDMLEGGVWLLQNRAGGYDHNWVAAPKKDRRF